MTRPWRACPSRAAGIAVAIALAGCADYDAVERVKAESRPVAVTDGWRFELSQELLPATKASWAPHITLISASDWPRSTTPPFGRYSGHTLRFGSFTGGVHSHITTLDSRTFLFLSTIRSLVYWEVGDSGQDRTVLRGVTLPKNHQLNFEVAVFEGKIVLVYATAASIMQLVATPVEAGLEFSEPMVIHSLKWNVWDLQLARSPDRLHMLWTEFRGYAYDSTLHYMHTSNLGGSWGPPDCVSDTTNMRSVNLAVDGRRIVLAWSDHRFRKRSWDTYRNNAKIFVVQSLDEGMSWSRPVLISDKTNTKDRTKRLLATFNEDRDVVLCWSADSDRDWRGKWEWQTGVLDSEFTVLTDTGVISSEQLFESYRKRMYGVLAADGITHGRTKRDSSSTRHREAGAHAIWDD